MVEDAKFNAYAEADAIRDAKAEEQYMALPAIRDPGRMPVMSAAKEHEGDWKPEEEVPLADIKHVFV